MRKLLFPLLLLLLGTSLQAQDLIIDKKGGQYKGIINNEDSSYLYVKLVRYKVRTQNDTIFNRKGTKAKVYYKPIEYRLVTDTLFSNVDVDTCIYDFYAPTPLDYHKYRFAHSFGLGFGGSTILGTSIEYKFSNRFGVEAGFGYGIGSGTTLSLNYHLSPSIRSSYFALNYWAKGIGHDYYQETLIGPSFVFRFKKLLTSQLGIGYIVDKGSAYNKSKAFPLNAEQDLHHAMILFSVGFYIPYK